MLISFFALSRAIWGWASLIAQLVKNPPAIQKSLFDSWVGKICWRRDRLPTPVFLGFPCGSAGKESACNAGDPGLIRELGRSPGEGKGYPLQYSGLENSMDCIGHGVTKNWTWLSDFNFHFHMRSQSGRGAWYLVILTTFSTLVEMVLWMVIVPLSFFITVIIITITSHVQFTFYITSYKMWSWHAPV